MINNDEVLIIDRFPPSRQNQANKQIMNANQTSLGANNQVFEIGLLP